MGVEMPGYWVQIEAATVDGQPVDGGTIDKVGGRLATYSVAISVEQDGPGVGVSLFMEAADPGDAVNDALEIVLDTLSDVGERSIFRSATVTTEAEFERLNGDQAEPSTYTRVPELGRAVRLEDLSAETYREWLVTGQWPGPGPAPDVASSPVAKFVQGVREEITRHEAERRAERSRHERENRKPNEG